MEAQVSSYYEEYRATRQRIAEQEAERQRKLDADKARNHAAWIKLCGLMAPIGELK